jgi:hypothetical protein
LADLGLGVEAEDAEMRAYIAQQNKEVEEMTPEELKKFDQVMQPKKVDHKPIVSASNPSKVMDDERFIDTSDFDKAFEADLEKVAQNPKEFLDLIATARANGSDEIVASEKVIAYYNKGKVPKANYFIYQNVKVFVEGKVEQTKAEIERSIY